MRKHGVAVARHASRVLVLGVASLLAFSSTRADDLNGELVFDFIRAQSSNDQPGAGEPGDMGAQDLGMRLRLAGTEGRVSTVIDYHGREPLGGDVENTELRLLYAAFLRYELQPKRLDVQVGRFLAPSVVLLPVDAVSTTFRSHGWTASAFGGRRGILTSRRNVPLDDYMPAAGASLSWRNTWIQLDGVTAYAEDDAILLKGGDEDQEVTRRNGAWNGYLHAWMRPIGNLSITGRTSLAERVGFVFGPTWESVETEVQTLDLFHGSLFLEWRPVRSVRLSYGVHTQRASVFRQGLLEDTGGGVVFTPEDSEPKFTDHRMQARWRAFDQGWVQAHTRVRLRPERRETRFGLSFDVHDLGLARLGLAGRWFHDQIDPEAGMGTRFDQDRSFFSGALAYRLETAELELGISRLERDAAPYSGRTENATSADDLGLFTLETESIAFTRLFVSRGRHFGGLDLELNLEDTNELRVFVQLGTRWERRG